MIGLIDTAQACFALLACLVDHGVDVQHLTSLHTTSGRQVEIFWDTEWTDTEMNKFAKCVRGDIRYACYFREKP